MRLVFISDTHNRLADLAVPDGDVLIHSGDFTRRGTAGEFKRFNAQMERLPHKHKLVSGGNNDLLLMTDPGQARTLLSAVTYLENEAVTVYGIKFYFNPHVPGHDTKFKAFTLTRGCGELARHRALIPQDTDVLVTHGPPYCILDKISTGESVGCRLLRARVEDLKPRVHAFGHVHEGYGILHDVENNIRYVNASMLDDKHEPARVPIIIDLN